MHPADLLDQMLDLARAADLEVRQVGRAEAGQGDIPPHSGVCRVKDRVWVLLVATDGIEERIAVLSQALATYARATLESRYLPPAIRDRLGAGFGGA